MPAHPVSEPRCLLIQRTLGVQPRQNKAAEDTQTQLSIAAPRPQAQRMSALIACTTPVARDLGKKKKRFG